ncbi:AMP-binding protein [Dactylosporangium sp. NPDC048998]|uniref:AMP-binding protein n=1 Tax=Dactylosporangium sp. NPDC048998 TaxID=3363976 RepID=UPI003715F364
MLDVLDRDGVVLRYQLERAARVAPDQTCVVFEDGSSWTRAEALREACASANELSRAGATRDRAVAAALPNGPAYLRTWWGAAMLGAPVVPFNTAYRGPMVRRLMRQAKPAVVVTTSQFRPHLIDAMDDAATGDLPAPAALLLDPAEIVGSDATTPVLDRPIEPWEPISLALTSGSTGPSKLVRVTYAQSMDSGQVNFSLWDIGAPDTYLSDIPMVHVSALYFLHASVGNLTRITVRSRPALDHYWEVARDTGATVSQLYSTMITYLDAQPPRGAERTHRLRVVVTVPLPPDPTGFAAKFGIEHLAIGYGSTETSCPIAARPGDGLPPGSIGRLRPGWDVRLVDEHDVEVPTGQPGEAVIRSSKPWLITTEYVDNPETTAHAWRNGWFHTGDLLCRDADGTFYYVDRLKDVIRRRGQNISSYEVESVIRTYPGITDVAIVAERSGVESEDEVKAWLIVKEPARMDFVDLLQFCTDRLAHYMVPRYFEIIDEFPRTASAKVKKQELRDRGGSERTWDRVVYGFDVRRTGLITIGGRRVDVR